MKKKPSGATGNVSKADALITPPFDRKKIEQAVGLLEAELDGQGGDSACHWRIARAWLRLLEQETGTVLEERKEFQPILNEVGKRALQAAELAHELAPGDVDAIGWHMVAYGYHSIAIGVVRAVLKGAAGKYLALAEELNDADERWLSAAGWRAMGRFYREAPWPKRDVSKAVECFERAVELGPKRQENKLHLALALADDGAGPDAAALLKKLLKGKPEPEEAHFHGALLDYARQKLGELG